MNPILFPGTFDPINNTHIDIARSVLRQTPFDTVVFMPVPANRTNKTVTTSVNDRLQMIKLAIKDKKEFAVSDAFNHHKPVKALKKAYRKFRPLWNKLIFKKIPTLKGYDSFQDMAHWAERGKQGKKDLKETFAIQQFYVFKETPNTKYDKKKFPKKFPINGSNVEVSRKFIEPDAQFNKRKSHHKRSSEIRSLFHPFYRSDVDNRKEIQQYLPQPVFNYIVAKKLYYPPPIAQAISDESCAV